MFPSIDASGPGNRLAENVMHFARVLRSAGLPIGPARALDAVRLQYVEQPLAVEAVADAARLRARSGVAIASMVMAR